MLAVPISDAPSQPGAAAPLAALFRRVHDELRSELDGLDDDDLNWVPAPGANSIATIITHLLGSEGETLRCVAGVASGRDRDAEFVRRWRTMREVLGLLARADHLIEDLEPLLGPQRLSADVRLPTLPDGKAQSGMTWLVTNYGHAPEHLGQVEITSQLRRSQRS